MDVLFGIRRSTVLARAPEVALVDELAHTNIPGCRNAKRWQDVEELLEAGIHVVSTVNIQHLESLNDVVERIKETIDVCEGLTEIAITTNPGGADHWKAIKAQELFAHHVIPRVREMTRDRV